MELTGKTKEEFEKWYMLKMFREENNPLLKGFYYSSFEMKVGVYEKYFDSVGIYIHIEPYLGGGCPVFYPEVLWRRKKDHIDTFWKPRFDDNELWYTEHKEKSQLKAIKQANIIRNEQLK